MKKTLVLFSLLLSVAALADQDNFVEKSFETAHHKCQKVQADVASWEAIKDDCLILKAMMDLRAKKNFEVAPVAEVAPAEPAIAPELAADLPKDEN